MHKKAARVILVTLVLVALVGCDLAMDQAGEQPVSQAPYETIAYLYAQETIAAAAVSSTAADQNAVSEEVEAKALPTDADDGESVVMQTATNEDITPSPTLTTSPTETVAPSSTSTSQPVYYPPSATFTLPPTHTATATATQTPTATNTPANTQAGGVVCNNGHATHLVAYMATPPSIDGNIRYWTSFIYQVPHLIKGHQSWAGAFDLSATFRSGWNEQYLFLAVTVQDERYIQNVDDGNEIYNGDSLEIVFDADLCGDFNDGAMNGDDYQIGITPGYVSVNGDKYAYRWFPRPSGRMYDVIVASVRGPGDVTIYEIGIPWSAIGVSNPAAGKGYGFTLSVSDNDNGSQNVQESMISSTYRNFNPKSWGTIILQ